MNKKVRAIIVDGTEIMTSLSAVEIADRLRTYDDLKDEINRLNNLIDSATQLYLKELSEKGKVDVLACKMFNTLEENIK